MAELSPMMKQYTQLKEQHSDCILFFRLGDFYEMFFDDARLASKELELVLTGRDCGQQERAPMCGVPYHSCEAYIARLVAKGYKVAICEQVEDASKAKGLVKRDIVRVVTPGTVTESSMLDESKNNYLAVVSIAGGDAGLCFVDASTGALFLTEISGADCYERAYTELSRFAPSEVLLWDASDAATDFAEKLRLRLDSRVELSDPTRFDEVICERTVLTHFRADKLSDLGLKGRSMPVTALGAALSYLAETQRNSLANINHIEIYCDAQYMQIDLSARRNLELFETLRTKEKRGSLLWVLDKTKTAMGKRLLREWLERPLMNCAGIVRRHNAVDELVSNPVLCSEIIEILSGIFDIERLMTRVLYGTANAREVKSLSFALGCLPRLKEKTASLSCAMLTDIHSDMDDMQDTHELIERALVDEPPLTMREGGLIREGYHEEVDLLRSVMTDGRSVISQVEANERERTGIKGLKVGYNRVFGYYIEVSKASKAEVPPEYIRKQTLSNCERYITQELKELEARVLGAKDRVVQLEFELFDELRKHVTQHYVRIQRTANAVAQLDVLCSLAAAARRNQYTRPDMSNDGRIVVRDGRHPVVETLLDTPFVPNDALLDADDNRCVLLTGPNMAGKSTYMRQVALIVVMAQLGSFVPASYASISIVDAVFTRVGASDDLTGGQSTFMVEMSEVANILHYATKNSLLLLDEIGRGTSTYDGMAIARAVMEYVVNKKCLGAKTFFATHYHELTALEQLLPGIKNYNVAVKKRGDSITFLRRIVPGGADDSYGIEVAKLAGIPDEVVDRAKQVLSELEENGVRPSAPALSKQPDTTDQLSLSGSATVEIIDKLKRMDVNTLTPIEAMGLLFELTKKATSL